MGITKKLRTESNLQYSIMMKMPNKILSKITEAISFPSFIFYIGLGQWAFDTENESSDILSRSPLNILRSLIELLVLALIGSGALCYLYVNYFGLPFDINTWSIALDISFAHLIVTLPLLWIATRIFKIAVRLTLNTAIFLGQIAAEYLELDTDKTVDTSNPREALPWLLYLLSVLFIVAAELYWVFKLVKFVLVDNRTLQMLLFGNYDAWLGAMYESTFRFTILFIRVKSIVQLFTSNQVVSTIVSFIVLAFSLVGGLVGIIKMLDDLGKSIKKRKE